MNEADLQLVRAAQQGDRNAFAELILRFKGKVFAAALALTGNAEEAAELTQESFVRAMQNLPRLEAPERFPAWVRGITTTLAKDARRKAARERRILQSAALEKPRAAEAVDVVLARRESSQRELTLLLELVNTLPENVRRALDLRFRRNLSYAQIGAELGVPASTVRGLLHRGTKTLRTKLQPVLRRKKSAGGIA